MSRRIQLIWRTLILCTAAVLIATVILLQLREDDAPYIAGEEQEGITRDLDRSLVQATPTIRFTDVTEQAGIQFEHFPFTRTSQLPEDMGSGAAWGDYDSDGLPDLFLVNFAAPLGINDEQMLASTATDRLYRNRGDGTFEDVTESTGLGTAHRGMGASWGDFDADGDLDLFVTSFGENLLWENIEGSFRNVTDQAGLGGEGFWAGASWSDFDLDGDLDLYVCGYVQYIAEEPGFAETRSGDTDFPFTLNPQSYPPHPNRFYVNRGDGTFEERAAAAGILGDKGRSLAAAWADFDADGLPDLYVANDVSDNMMFLNNGDGTFENVSYQALVADYRGSMGIAVGDWDGDLDLDLFITHWIAQENALYSNLLTDLKLAESDRRLMFEDQADRVGLGQIALDLIGWGTAFVDLDSDGLLDLFVANGSTFQSRGDRSRLVSMDPHLYWNRGASTGFFEVGETAGIRTQPQGVGRGAAFADYDRDGDLDLVILHHGASARLLRNDSNRGHWVALQFRGTSGHPSGLGARIVVHAGGQRQLREAGVGPSYLSQNHAEEVVGLGNATLIDRLEITWPGGDKEVWHSLDVDRRWVLEEGQEPRAISRAGKATVPHRLTSGVSKHAIVTDLSSTLSPEEKVRFWQLRKRASRLFGEGKWTEAADLFDQMIQLDPTHEDALYYRGNCQLELGNYNLARDSWERLLQVNPSSSRALVQIGILHTLAGANDNYDLEAATAAFQQAHRINREESRPLVLLGEAALALGNLDSAGKALTSAYRMNPRATSALYLSSYIEWKRGNQDRAGELLDMAYRSLEVAEPVQGVLGEGDTRSTLMAESRDRAEGRRLFSGCVASLRATDSSLDPNVILPCVDRALADLR
jgi:Flp pilus assembly protein TadD